MMAKFLLLIMSSLLIVSFCSGANSPPPPPVTDATLIQVAGSLQMFVDPLPQMPTIYGYNNSSGTPQPTSITIGMYQKQWKFHRDLPPTTVFAYGTSAADATVPGPTIEALKGVPVSVTWQNFLPQNHILPWDPTIPTAIPMSGGVPTVVHLHGGVHDPTNDGSAFAWFTANFSEIGPAWTKPTYTYPNVQHAGNMWYHDHALGLTRENLLAGLIGAYIVREPAVELPLDLPFGAEFDRRFMIFDRSFNTDGSLYINNTGIIPSVHPQWQPEYFGHAIIVNGKAWPFMNVQRRKYRFRMTNAANARYFHLSLSNGVYFTQIGADASYLPAPLQLQTILLGPAETADVIIDFSTATATEILMNNDAPYPYPNGDPVDNLNSKVMKFVIATGNPSVPDISTIPTSLVSYQGSTTDPIATTRYLALYEYTDPSGSPTHLYINGKRVEDPVTETPKSGTTEIWEVINLTGDNHPLHIHLATYQATRVQPLTNVDQFTSCMTQQYDALACNVTSYLSGQVLDIPANEKTWKTTVKLAPGTMTTVVVKFNLVETNSPYPFDPTLAPGYAYHCHILDHEDNAMIRPLVVLP
ncbi:PREDICTED: multicopper oxidase LPR1-like [Nelumbo nucifera]|uniref:Multicopper oxidase LPR1-like n=2 Tax=Nelumbo nucifera TaxID=4432 RepID=A0A822YHM1_NELNU|nr:PREDICTED: multicopper oxidase LPR1-like [Nelumbo nucifera]DAD32007.1 TPA_asm: hypothetical protein HUJ06_010858 [Nelumbo nucifera]